MGLRDDASIHQRAPAGFVRIRIYRIRRIIRIRRARAAERNPVNPIILKILILTIAPTVQQSRAWEPPDAPAHRNPARDSRRNRIRARAGGGESGADTSFRGEDRDGGGEGVGRVGRLLSVPASGLWGLRGEVSPAAFVRIRIFRIMGFSG